MNSEGKKLLTDLISAVQCNDAKTIKELKYKILYYGTNLFSVVSNYIFLEKIGIHFNFGSKVIKKGTRFYRIRKFQDGMNINDPKEWDYPPSTPENRANLSGEVALYLGTTEVVCLLETHIQNGETYVLGEYEAIDDITVGGFLDCESYKETSYFLAGVILNAFFIAPSRNDKNSSLFQFLDSHYKNLSPDDLTYSIANDFELPFKFGVLNKRNEFYKTTNSLIESIKHKYKEGFIYSSCYLPVMTVGITSNTYNVVLYEEGMRKVKFVKAIKKVNSEEFTDVTILKTFLERSSNAKNNKRNS